MRRALLLLLAPVLLLVPAGPADAAGTLQLGTVFYNPPGNELYAPNGEWVTVRNTGTTAVSLAGLRLRDAGTYSYDFPARPLAAGASVRVHVGSGRDTPTVLYSGKPRAVWNNSGDTARLLRSGAVVDSCTWRDTDAVSTACR